MKTDITRPEPCLRVYPDDDTVFAGDVARYRRHMVPLLSVDLQEVNSTWRGWIHVVSPHEPYDGVLGGETHPCHAGYLQENWLAFRLDEQDRYHLMGDWRFFLAECTSPVASDMSLKYLRDHVNKLEARYQAQKKLFMAQGRLPDYSGKSSLALVEQLGGSAWFDNWCSMGLHGPVPVNTQDPDDVHPITPDGKRFHFVCFVEANHYGHHHSGIVLFFEPESRTALLTFNWT
jgi:hypothetical protein